jgi:TonB-linked SusC/RagA family outer membrane protein
MRFKKEVFILIFILISVGLRAQTVNLVRKNIALLQLFKEIKSQTGYSVVWNEQAFTANQNLDVSFRNAGLKQVMDYLLGKLPLLYTIENKMVIVKDRKKTGDSLPNKPLDADSLKNDDVLKEYDLYQVDIVSTGYQQTPKDQSTGSFILVDNAQINRKVSGDLITRLDGITSGLLFNKNTLVSGSGGLDLSIRGRSTIYANDQPLIILDNFPFNASWNALNPNDVSSVTVLKDAAAAAIWGVRAGNGVIVITTKKGKFKMPLNVSFNSNLTLSGKADVFYNPYYLSSSDYIDIETFLFNNGKYDAALADPVNSAELSQVVRLLDKQKKGYSSSETAIQLNALRAQDFRKEELKYYYQKPVSQQYFVNMSGGTKKSTHYLSAGYDRSLLSLRNNQDNRITVNTHHTVKIGKHLELTGGLYYVGNIGKMDSTIFQTVNATPYYQFKDQNGKPTVFNRGRSAEFQTNALSQGFLDWTYVPLDELDRNTSHVNNNDYRVNMGLKYTIIAGLNAEIKYQNERIKNTAEVLRSQESYIVRDMINRYSIIDGGRVVGYHVPVGAIQFQNVNRIRSQNFRAELNYQKGWENHEVGAIAGYELSEYDTENYIYSKYGYDASTGQSVAVDTSTLFNLNPSGRGNISTVANLYGKLDRIRSAFAKVSYTYEGKYMLSGSMRTDASNYFGVKTNQKYVPLWSTGFLWRLDQENFYKLNWLPVLKLRASYGFNGNLDKKNTGVITFAYSGVLNVGSNLPYAFVSSIGNPELRWEKIGIANFGIDFGFKEQVVSGKVEFYLKKGTGMIGDKAFPASTGIKVLRGNYSEMKSSGIDISIHSHNLRGRISWQTDFLLSTAHDKVSRYDYLEQGSILYTGEYNSRPVLNRPVFGIYSYKWAGLDPSNGDPRGFFKGEVSKDYGRIVTETGITDLEYNGPARPTIFGAFNNTISFNRFTVGVNISYKLGYYFRKPSVNYYKMYQFSIIENSNVDFNRRWQKPGDEMTTKVPSMGTYGSDANRDRFYNGSSATVVKGDHIRLQDISLSYDCNLANWKKIPFKQIQLYVYANELGLIWKANDFGLDPDLISSFYGRLLNPRAKSISFGIKAGF